VFSKQFDVGEPETILNNIRRELAGLVLKAEGADMYDNKITVQRELSWFARHLDGKGG
jgi:hypothetical protein